MEYEELVEKNEKYLILFWAEWAPPSVELKQRLEGFNQLPVIMINSEESPKTTLEFGIKALPTLILMEGSEPLKRKVGYDPEETIGGLLADL